MCIPSWERVIEEAEAKPKKRQVRAINVDRRWRTTPIAKLEARTLAEFMCSMFIGKE